MEVEADMARRLAWLTGRAALEGLGVTGESAGLDMPSKELGEAIIVKVSGAESASILSHRWIEGLRKTVQGSFVWSQVWASVWLDERGLEVDLQALVSS